MTDQPVKNRFAETRLGFVLGWLLALGWMVVMACTDINAYTALPLCVVGGVAVLLFAVGVLRGDKMVRLTPTAWFGLAVGVYFLLRCFAAPSVVESWGQLALLLGCAVYYVAGVQAAQGSGRAVAGFLVAAVLVNAAYFGLMRLPEASVAWSGRPELGLTGPNSRPTGLFFYENFAGYFFIAGGFVLLYLSLTSRASRGRRLILLIPALLSMGLAGCCNTLSPLIASLILLPFGWVLFCLHRVASGRSLGFASFLVSAFLLVAISVAVYGLVWGHFFDWLANDVDTHLRYQIWGDLVQQLGASGLWGQGAGASQWSIATIFNEWCRPNFAHNEYLQAWVDFGGVGLALMLLFLVLHLSAGLMTLSSDAITPERRQLVSVALLLMASMSVCAFSDYYWHDAAMALMMAFTCGLLASPHDRRGERLIRRVGSHDLSAEPVLRRVRAAGRLERCLLVLASAALIFGFARLGQRFYIPWVAQWSVGHDTHEPGFVAERCRTLRSLVPIYPDYLLADACVRLDPVMSERGSLDEMIDLMGMTLRANPRNTFNVSMLAHLLTRRGRFLESEKLQRRYYGGDGPSPTCLGSWHVNYGRNLLLWGMEDCREGKLGEGLSKMRYALNIHSHAPLHIQTLWRPDRTWEVSSSVKGYNQLLKDSADYVRLLELSGVQTDDGWRRPLEPGGKPSLYQRWGLKPAEPRAR